MKKKHTAEEKQNWQDPLLRTAITVEEIENLAAQIRVGDKIKWEVLYGDITIQKGYRKRPVTLTVTRKSRYLLETADGMGRMHSIRYAELAEARRKDLARLKEMNTSARRAAG